MINGYESCKTPLIYVFVDLMVHKFNSRGGEWYLEKHVTFSLRGSRKILAGSRNLGNVFDKSRSLVFVWFVFTFLSLETFYQRVLGADF